MVISENNYDNDINLLYYKEHTFLIKDINKYLHRR